MVSGQLRASHVVFRVPGRVSTGRISALDTAEVTGTHHLAESLAEVADGLTDPAVTGPSWAAAQIARDNRGVGGQGGAPLPGREYGRALSYEYVDDPRRDAVTRAARQTGINEGAWAEVGEGYLVQSISAADDEGKPTLAVNYAKPTASNRSHFGYHFATVVLASEDGQSQLTLENHARVSRNKAEMNAAVEENLRSSAAQLRELAARLHERARFAEQVGADSARQDALKSRARLADLLVTAREARDRGASEEEQNRTFQQAARAVPQAASMIDGKHQWYFRSYSRRPGESMHESHAELLSDDHASAEANPLTLVVLHGHAVSAPEHRFIPFEESGALADSAGYKLDHLAEHIVRTGLWNLAHGLRLPSVRLVTTAAAQRISTATSPWPTGSATNCAAESPPCSTTAERPRPPTTSRSTSPPPSTTPTTKPAAPRSRSRSITGATSRTTTSRRKTGDAGNGDRPGIQSFDVAQRSVRSRKASRSTPLRSLRPTAEASGTGFGRPDPSPPTDALGTLRSPIRTACRARPAVHPAVPRCTGHWPSAEGSSGESSAPTGQARQAKNQS